MIIAVNTRFLLKDKLEGIGWFTYESIRRIVLQHPQHQFIFFFDRAYDPQFVFADNVKPIVLFPPARHPILFYIWFEWTVAKALKKYKADLFISTDGFLSLKTKVPTLLVIHDLAYQHFPEQVSFLQRKYYEYFMPKFAHKASRIATVSEYSKQEVVHFFNIDKNNIDVVYNGCRTEFIPLKEDEKKVIRDKYAEGQNYFFYVGAIHPRKNVHRLIQAFDHFKKRTQSPMKLLLAGRFAWKTGLIRDTYERAKCQDDIIFLGYVTEKELPLLMGAAFALTYVSLFEGFGIPLVEAMNCDIPIITSTISSLPEVAGKAALIVNPESVEAITHAMEKLFQNVDLRKELLRNAKIQREKFSWDLTAERMIDSIQKILSL